MAENARNLRMVVAYDGTEFKGWQRQATGPTIQEELERAFSVIARRPRAQVHIAGAGRTDAGVHALAQVASIVTDADNDLELLARGMNAILPLGIVVRRIDEVDREFHARFSARGKIYRYAIALDAQRPAHDVRTVYWVRQPLDIEAIAAAARHFVGRHDFSSFTTRVVDANVTVRDLDRLDVEVRGDRLELTFQSRGFLYNMVRAITGTLVEVGLGRRDPDSMDAILHARLRRIAGDNAPAHGLTLLEVLYASNVLP